MSEPTQAGRDLLERIRRWSEDEGATWRYSDDEDIGSRILAIEAEARAAALAEREALREAVRAEIGRLERAGWPHEYTYGYHKEPGCRGCEMLGRLLAALAETPKETRHD